MTDWRLLPGPGGSVPERSADPAPSPPDHPGGLDAGLAPDDASDLRRYWRVLRRRHRLVAVVLAVVFFGTAIGTLLRPRIYRATATIEIRRPENMPVDELLDVERMSDQYLETQYAILGSWELARRVARDLDLTHVREFNPNPAEAPDSGVPEAVTEAVQDRLLIDPVRGSLLVRIGFESRSRALAERAVASTIRNYIALRITASRASVEQLSAQVDSVKKRLTDSEQQLQDYTRANGLVFVTGGGDGPSLAEDRVRRLQEQLTDAEAERYQLQPRYDLSRARDLDYLDSPELRELNAKAADLRTEYAKLRATFTDSFPRTREVKRQLDQVDLLVAQERARVADVIAHDYSAAVQRQELLKGALRREQARSDSLAGRMTQYRILKRNVDAHEQLYSLLQQKRTQAEVSAAMAGTAVGMVEPALAPNTPVQPAPMRDLPLAAVVGLILGVGLAFLREYLDPAVRFEQLEATSVPVLALIPIESDGTYALPRNGRSKGRDSLTRLQEAELTEAFGELRTSVLFGLSEPVRSLLVTSGQPGEGKTTVCVHLARSLARVGKRVLLIEADLRRPSVHRLLRMSRREGLTDALSGHRQWQELVWSESDTGLNVLFCGRPRPNPSELLSSQAMDTVLGEAIDSYDLVLVDSPALFAHVADSRILAPLADGVILVARSGTTHRDALRRMLRQIPNAIGVVLNAVEAQSLPPYYADYASYRQTDASRGNGSRTVAEDEATEAPTPERRAPEWERLRSIRRMEI